MERNRTWDSPHPTVEGKTDSNYFKNIVFLIYDNSIQVQWSLKPLNLESVGVCGVSSPYAKPWRFTAEGLTQGFLKVSEVNKF